MSGRDQMLGKIRRSLGVSADDGARRARVTSRMKRAAPSLIPARGQVPGPQKIDLFCEQAEAVMSSTARVSSRAGVPAAIADYLRQHNLPPQIRTGADLRLAGLPWETTPHLERSDGVSDGSDAVGVSHAFAGVAETGSLMMTSGPDNPTTLNFLPDSHIVVLSADDIAGDYETVWTNIRKQYGKGVMPRTVNMITGPSRSADIEQKLLLGAHGPRALHIIVVEEDG
ncbi:MAG: LutC/YkgG family protein [Alphaproteobacteria bacterium]